MGTKRNCDQNYPGVLSNLICPRKKSAQSALSYPDFFINNRLPWFLRASYQIAIYLKNGLNVSLRTLWLRLISCLIVEQGGCTISPPPLLCKL